MVYSDDDLEDLYKEFEGRWCSVFFEDGSRAILKVLKVSSGNLLCQNIRGGKKLISIYEIRGIDQFDGVILSTGEKVQNGVVVSTLKEGV